MNKTFPRVIAVAALLALLVPHVPAAQKIYWGDSVPPGWNGKWPAKYLTVPERTDFERTASSTEVLEFIDTMRWASDKMYVFNMFTTTLRRTCPAVVLANPRVTSPDEAAKSGKTVVYLQGNIHAYEPEAKEALMMLLRDILLGKRKGLLDNLIIIVCPNFNVDGTDTLSLSEGTPHLLGSAVNAQNINLNRDAIRLETAEVAGLYRTVFNRWDPTLIYDGHLMGRVQHGYAIGYATCTVPASHPGPRNYVFDKLFPAVREATRKNYGLEVFTHCETDGKWPPTVWSHEKAMWTNEAKFVANAYGLRNRMTILAETPGHESFERRIYAHYALITGVLEYANAHGKEMQEVCRAADRDVVEAVKAKAETGELRNFVAGTYESYGKVDILVYKERNVSTLIPGTSVRARIAPHMLRAPELVRGVEFLCKPVGTAEALVPRGYLIPAELDFIAEKLRAQNVKVEVLAKPVKVSGEEFVIDKVGQGRSGGYNMIKLDGGFAPSPVREFPAGTFRVDMAQSLANVAFYCLEPQAADGFVGWGIFDATFKSLGVDKRSVVYPIYKYFKVLE
ncbi:MAG: M14 family metallopeptidase [Acidobacteria bacterium]|nr:M14 family metallopeptidase [Acidobacteriota bacterium]MBE3129734.1 M14 family metallopeptidase [Acidobacteriota bacterium]